MTEQTLNSWRDQQERSSLAFLKLMVWISLRLGRPVGRCVLSVVALYFLLFSARARSASRSYLREVMGRPIRMIDQYRHFYAFASTIHDRIYLLNDQFDLYDIEATGTEELMQEAQRAPGALLVGGHLGSFEVLRALGRGRSGFNVAMMMYEGNALKINATLEAINPKASQDIVSLGRMESMLEVRERLDSGYLVGMLADRFLGHNGQVNCDFLNKPAVFPLGPWRAAAMMRRPVFFMVGLYMGRNRYRIHFERLADFSQVPRGKREAAIERAAQDYADRLTHYCRLAPYNWFNFFDFWDAR
jgi:predicted LPLAT superfamily acyltransferase